MKGKPEVIKALNDLLAVLWPTTANVLISVSMLKKWGLNETAKLFINIYRNELKSSIKISNRIVFLDAIPNIENFDNIYSVENIEKMLLSMQKSQMDVITMCGEGIEISTKFKDYGTRSLFENILIKADHVLAKIEAEIAKSMRG